MKLDLPSARQPLLGAGNVPASPFYAFWEAVRRALLGLGGPVMLPAYTVATLPDVTAHAGGMIYVKDGASNRRLAVSDGTDWRFPDGDVVS